MGSFCGGQQSTTTSSVTSLDPTVKQFGYDTLAKAKEVAGRDYVANPNPRVADFTADQTAAFDKIRSSLGGWKPTLDTATGLATTGANMSITDPAALDKFMSPYVEGVINPQLRELDRRTEIARRGVTARANTAGQGNSARHGVVEGELMRNSMMMGDDIVKKGYGDAFTSAMTALEKEAQRKLIGGDALLKQAAGGQQLNGIDLSQLLSIGGQQQGQDQKNLDVLTADFLRQQGYPQEQLNILLSALKGTPYSSSTTTTGPGGSTSAQNLGSLAALLGAGGKIGESIGWGNLNPGNWDWSWLG
jgi:hypothetical protein